MSWKMYENQKKNNKKTKHKLVKVCSTFIRFRCVSLMYKFRAIFLPIQRGEGGRFIMVIISTGTAEACNFMKWSKQLMLEKKVNTWRLNIAGNRSCVASAHFFCVRFAQFTTNGIHSRVRYLVKQTEHLEPVFGKVIIPSTLWAWKRTMFY